MRIGFVALTNLRVWDDNTFADKAHSRDLMKAVAKTDFTFFAETDLSIADHPDLLALMRDAGCGQVLIGFESPDFTPHSRLDGRIGVIAIGYIPFPDLSVY